MRISELKEPYKSMAEKNRKIQGWSKRQDILFEAFFWDDSLEGIDFWNDVDNGNYPEIPTVKKRDYLLTVLIIAFVALSAWLFINY